MCIYCMQCCFSNKCKDLFLLPFFNHLPALIFVSFFLFQHVNVMVTLLSVGSVWPCISSLVESVEAFVWSAGTTQQDATASSARTDTRVTTANHSATARPANVSNNWFLCMFYVSAGMSVSESFLLFPQVKKEKLFFLALPSVGSEVCERQHSLCLCYGYTMSDGMCTDTCPLTALLSMARSQSILVNVPA